MANIGLVSPGVKVREVDLTVGRIDSISDTTGAIVGPFPQGPVGEAIQIDNEQDLLDFYGKPYHQIDSMSIGIQLQIILIMVVF